MGIIERIKEIEAEMARTQKDKATEYHLGQLKAKIAKLRTQLLEPPKGSSGGGEGFEVTKFGHGRVALIGFPSVGKSTLLTTLTGTHSEAASYDGMSLLHLPASLESFTIMILRFNCLIFLELSRVLPKRRDVEGRSLLWPNHQILY